jgi:hypothetical protein
MRGTGEEGVDGDKFVYHDNILFLSGLGLRTFVVEGTFSHFDTEALQGARPGLTALLYAAEGAAARA